MTTIRVATEQEVREFVAKERDRLRQSAQSNDVSDRMLESRQERHLIGEADLDLYRGGVPYLLFDQGTTLSINITRCSAKKRISAWGRYANCYLAYTAAGYRQRGYATALYIWLQHTLAADGYERLRSLIGSWGGFRLHLGLGHTIWGVEVNGHLVVDTPLTRRPFPSGTPPQIRTYGLQEDWSIEHLVTVLTDPAGRFQRPEAEVRSLFSRRVPVLGKPRNAPALMQL